MFKEALKKLKEAGLYRSLKVIDGPQAAYVEIGGRRLLNLCSNNYLGLANDPRLKQAAIDAIEKFGIGSGASRLICGNMSPHERLEKKIASFKQQDAALVFNSGYSANTGIISSVVSKDGIIFSDHLNHASIIDGIILSRAEFKRYPHKDIQALEDLLKKSAKFKKRLIVTDTVFSMDGDIAPLPQILALAQKYDCLLMIDEAHAIGVLGETGRGALEYFGLEPTDRVIQMGTLSKALGCFGAYVCGSQELKDYLINFSRNFIYTTSLPPLLAACAIKAIEIVEEEPSRRKNLWSNIEFLKNGLKGLGFDIGESLSAIIPLMTYDIGLTLKFSQRVFKQGLLVQAIRPPTVPKGKSRLRITIMATHTKEDLNLALKVLKKVGKELGII